MAFNLNKFFGLKKIAKWARNLKKRLPSEVNEVTKSAAKAALRSLVDETPVDTSKALSNWQVGLNSRPESYIPAHSPGEKGNTKQESADIAFGIGETTIDARKKETINIVNNAPYIDDLEGGTATQPGGMIERAVAMANLEIEKSRITIDT